MIEAFIPNPRLRELDQIEVGVPADVAYEAIRHLDLASSTLVRALFSLRTIPERLHGDPAPLRLSVDDITGAGSAFHLLAEEPGRGFVVGAIGCFWKPAIRWAGVAPDEFAAFAEPGWAKVAWSVMVEPRGERGARIVLALRLDATDEAAWRALRRYYRLIGPFSRFIRRHMLRQLLHRLGSERDAERRMALPGDALLADAADGDTTGIDIAATPQAIWPWLVQMGCRRGGWYSYDLLDNGAVPSAAEIIPCLQSIAVGDMLPARPESDVAFEVLQIEPHRALVLGGLYDVGSGRQARFASKRPARYWQVTWAFVLRPLDAHTTRLTVRARVAFAPAATGLRALWLAPVHHFMEAEQLRNLKLRAEGRLVPNRDDWVDVGEGVVGALAILVDLATPFLRGLRNRWGLDREMASFDYPGDDEIPAPRWQWTHGIEIERPAADVWGWVSQIGANRAGFYSYQWLENLVGCQVRNADRVHPEWQLRHGDALRLHPKLPPLRIVSVEEGRWIVARGGQRDDPTGSGRPGSSMSCR